MKTLDTWRDAAIGETRYALAREGRLVMLRITRWSDAGRRALWSEAYVGRVRSVEPALRGAFVDLGLKEEQGFLPLDREGQASLSPPAGDLKKKRVAEGQLIAVRIAREGVRGKGPVLGLLDRDPPQPRVGRFARHEGDEDDEKAPPASPELRSKLDEAVEEALSRQVALPGGGLITIEPTAALTAIDVDAAGRKGGADAERFALELNLEAAREAMRQLRLRAQGGIAAIDFVSMREAQNRKAVERALKDAAMHDPWNPMFAPMNRFGVVELSRAQYSRPVRDVLLDIDGRKSPETVGLETLRAVEREAARARGRKIVAGVAPDVAAWLEAKEIPWREALEARIGGYWDICSVKTLARERIDVRAA